MSCSVAVPVLDELRNRIKIIDNAAEGIVSCKTGNSVIDACDVGAEGGCGITDFLGKCFFINPETFAQLRVGCLKVCCLERGGLESSVAKDQGDCISIIASRWVLRTPIQPPESVQPVDQRSADPFPVQSVPGSGVLLIEYTEPSIA